MKYNQNTQFKLQVNQRIKHLIESKSSDQGEYLLIKNFDPGRGWFYRYYESDYPLKYYMTIVAILELEYRRSPE